MIFIVSRTVTVVPSSLLADNEGIVLSRCTRGYNCREKWRENQPRNFSIIIPLTWSKTMTRKMTFSRKVYQCIAIVFETIRDLGSLSWIVKVFVVNKSFHDCPTLRIVTIEHWTRSWYCDTSLLLRQTESTSLRTKRARKSHFQIILKPRTKCTELHGDRVQCERRTLHRVYLFRVVPWVWLWRVPRVFYDPYYPPNTSFSYS